jgi:hypothetical protein
MTGSVDHPSFDALRTHLGVKGFIEIERKWWNGDKVLIPFKLNNLTFEEGDQFSSGGALYYDLDTQEPSQEPPPILEDELFRLT